MHFWWTRQRRFLAPQVRYHVTSERYMYIYMYVSSQELVQSSLRTVLSLIETVRFDIHHRELQARWFINRLKAGGDVPPPPPPSHEKIPFCILELEFQHGLKSKGCSGSCVNLPLSKAVGLYSSFQSDECESQPFTRRREKKASWKTTCFQTKRHTRAGVCRPFEGEPDVQHRKRFEKSSWSAKK